ASPSLTPTSSPSPSLTPSPSPSPPPSSIALSAPISTPGEGKVVIDTPMTLEGDVESEGGVEVKATIMVTMSTWTIRGNLSLTPTSTLNFTHLGVGFKPIQVDGCAHLDGQLVLH